MKKIIWVLTLSTFLLASCGKTEEVVKQEVEKKYAKIETIALSNFAEELKLTWKIASSKETVISAQIGWAIKQVNYKVWDRVNAWDVLAVIDDRANLLSVNLQNASNSYANTSNVYALTKESIRKDLDSAKLQLENAKTSRDNTYKTTDEQLKLAQTQLDNVNTTDKNTKDTSGIAIDLSKKSLETAKINLANFEKNYTETISSLNTKNKNLLKNIDSSINSSLTSIDSALTYADTILWVSSENRYLNDSYEVYLWAKDTSTKTKAETDYTTARTYYNKLNSSNDDTLTQLDNLKTLADKTVTLYNDLVKVTDNSIVSSSFNDATLSAMKASIKANQATVLWVRATAINLQSSQDDLASTISSTKTSLETQKTSLNQAIIIAETSLQNTLSSTNTNLDSISGNKTLLQNQLQSTIATIKSSRDAVDNAVKIRENNYNSSKAKLDASLASTKNQLDSSAWQKNQLLQQIDNTLIKAPFSGVITAKNIEIGQMLWAGTPAFSISNENSQIVKLDLNSDNIKFVKLGQEVIISKSGKEIKWNVSLVSASADSVTRMYKVEVSFDFTKFPDVVLGDYVDVFMKKETSGDKNLIVIPFTALITSSTWDFSVYKVWSGSLISITKIKIWDSNSHELVVTSWLKVWDKIVTEWTLNLSEGDTVQE